MENKYPRYINVLTIIIFNCEFSWKIGNPLWFIQEFKNIEKRKRKMSNEEKEKYYHKINNLDIQLCETNHKYIMIHQWSKDFSHKWGIAVFKYENDEYYWYLRTYGNLNSKEIDWYDFGCLVDLGYKWIKELGWDR